MNDNDPSHVPESQLPEWLQREADAIREQQALDRLKVAIAALVVTLSGIMAICAIGRVGGLG